MAAGNRAARVKTITNVPSVGVIKLDFRNSLSLSTDVPEPAEFKIMVQKNAGGVAKLQQALRANPVTRAAIVKRGIGFNQIAGAQIATSGALRLYIFSKWNTRP